MPFVQYRKQSFVYGHKFSLFSNSFEYFIIDTSSYELYNKGVESVTFSKSIITNYTMENSCSAIGRGGKVMKLKRFTKRSLYEFLSRFFELDKCKWYVFDRADRNVYYLTGLGYEYVLNYSFGCLRIACRDVNDDYRDVKMFFWDFRYPDQLESMKQLDIFDIETTSQASQASQASQVSQASCDSSDSLESSEDPVVVPSMVADNAGESVATFTQSNVSADVHAVLEGNAAHKLALDDFLVRRQFSQSVAGISPRLPT